MPVEIRHCEQTDPLRPSKMEKPRQLVWMKAIGTLGNDPRTHQCVAAYESDNRLLSTSLLAHGLNPLYGGVSLMASLDHSMWFHAPFRYPF